MSTALQPTHATVSAPPVADQASLILTVYGTPQVIETIVTDIHNQVPGLQTILHSHRRLWRDDGNTLLLERMTLPGAPAHDAQIVQVILNDPDAARTAWRRMFVRLRDSGILATVQKQIAATQQEADGTEHLWGLTLVYQAILTGAVPDPEQALQQINPLVWRLPPGVDYAHPLARVDVPGGMLWLLDLPLADASPSVDPSHRDKTTSDLPLTIYAALVTPDQNDALVKQYLCGPDAALLIPDLIAHKAYFHIRQYRRPDWLRRYTQQVTMLRTRAVALLEHTSPVASVGRATRLNDLKHAAMTLLQITALLDTLHVRLQEQRTNATIWVPRQPLGKVQAYHQQRLDLALQELPLRIAQGRTTLEVAHTAVTILQAEHEQREQQREQTMATWLAVAGVVLAVPQLLTAEVATVVILEGAVSPLLRILGQTPPTSYWLGWAVLVQIVVILLMLLVMRYGLRWWRGRRQE